VRGACGERVEPASAQGASRSLEGTHRPMTDPTSARNLIYRLPRKVDFPFGYEVSVVQGAPDVDDRVAEWDVDTRTIVVDRRLPPAEKRGAFLHELDHAWSDWKLWVAQNVPVKYPDALEPDPAEKDDDGSGDTTAAAEGV
jgi:hypothetical protein